MPCLPCRIDEARQGNIETGHGRDQRLTDGEARPTVGALEVLEWRQVRRKSIGFVLKTTDRNRF